MVNGIRKELIICLGSPCSGKTTWTKELTSNNSNYLRVSYDELVSMLVGNAEFVSLSSSFTNVYCNIIRMIYGYTGNVVVDGFPINPTALTNIIRFASNPYYNSVRLVLFHVELKDAYIRNASRAKQGGHQVEAGSIRNYYDNFCLFLLSKELEEISKMDNVTIQNEYSSQPQFNN